MMTCWERLETGLHRHLEKGSESGSLESECEVSGRGSEDHLPLCEMSHLSNLCLQKPFLAAGFALGSPLDGGLDSCADTEASGTWRSRTCS